METVWASFLIPVALTILDSSLKPTSSIKST
jgi:hypothetical protein